MGEVYEFKPIVHITRDMIIAGARELDEPYSLSARFLIAEKVIKKALASNTEITVMSDL